MDTLSGVNMQPGVMHLNRFAIILSVHDTANTMNTFQSEPASL